MGFPRVSRQLATFTFAGMALLAVACGSKSHLADGGTVATGGGTGATQTGGSPAAGGVSGQGGAIGAGGNPGAGTADAGPACTDDGGAALPAAARRCAQDSDCTIAIAARCCGSDQAVGVAKAQSSAYAPCLALPAGACQGLGCAKFFGYTTDTGKTTPVSNITDQPIDWITVRCSNQICTTDVIAVQDGGNDVAMTDAPTDAAAQKCGNDPPCGKGQACVLVTGGPMPPCSAPSDAGDCPTGQVLATSCLEPGTGLTRMPGCTTPAPTPHCTQLADGCDGTCACVCPAIGGAGCFSTGGTITCGMP